MEGDKVGMKTILCTLGLDEEEQNEQKNVLSILLKREFMNGRGEHFQTDLEGQRRVGIIHCSAAVIGDAEMQLYS